MGKAITEIGTYAGPISATTKIPVSDGDTLQQATAAQLVDYNTAATHAATSKATPVDADELPLVDSAASNVLKKLTWSNLKATLKTYLDTLYQATLVSGTNIKTINSTSILGSGDLTVSATPGGSTTQIQYNNAGAFAGASGITTTGDRLDFSANASAQNVASMKIAGQYGDVYVGGYAGILILATGANLISSTNCRIGPIDISLASDGTIGFASSATGAIGVGSDTRFVRDSAGVLKILDSGSNLRDLKLRNLIGTGNLTTGIVAKTADYTATADDGSIEVDATSGAVTITLPAVSGAAGRIYTIKKTDASGNAVTVDPNASETIDGATTASLASQYSTITIQANAAGTAWHKLSGI